LCFPYKTMHSMQNRTWVPLHYRQVFRIGSYVLL
jgi:hypothetical protein